MQIGDRVSFGEYEWRVLDVRENRALLLTEYIIEQRPYHDASTETTWRTAQFAGT